MPDGATPRATRQAYRDRLVSLMSAHERVLCLDSDTGLFVPGDFGVAANRYLNLGIAEHNLMGAAAGLAASGWMPFVNTMAAFASTRALESVKVDIAYNDLPVRIMATHGGLSAGHLGPTHHALEDLAIMRMLPNMTVVVPADAAAAEDVVIQALEMPGPVYVRLGRKPVLPVPAPPPLIGEIQRLRDGGDLVIACCGPHPVLASLQAADTLTRSGVGAAVLNVHTLKPLDTEALLEATETAALVVTVEEHWRTGGLGAAVAETLSESAPVRLVRIGMPDAFAGTVGDHEFLLERYGITTDAIVWRIQRCLGLSPVALEPSTPLEFSGTPHHAKGAAVPLARSFP